MLFYVMLFCFWRHFSSISCHATKNPKHGLPIKNSYHNYHPYVRVVYGWSNKFVKHCKHTVWPNSDKKKWTKGWQNPQNKRLHTKISFLLWNMVAGASWCGAALKPQGLDGLQADIVYAIGCHLKWKSPSRSECICTSLTVTVRYTL